MEIALTLTAFLASLLAAFSDWIKSRFGDTGKYAVMALSVVCAAAAGGFSYESHLQNVDQKNKEAAQVDMAAHGIALSIEKSTAQFGAPLALFYEDLRDQFADDHDLEKLGAPEVIEAMQRACFFDTPKSHPLNGHETWGELFAASTRSGIRELDEAVSLYQKYMTPMQLRAIDEMKHDELVRILEVRSDFSSERNSPLISHGSCAGLTPIGMFQAYLNHLAQLTKAGRKEGGSITSVQ
jgi:hypothetical protein